MSSPYIRHLLACAALAMAFGCGSDGPPSPSASGTLTTASYRGTFSYDGRMLTATVTLSTDGTRAFLGFEGVYPCEVTQCGIELSEHQATVSGSVLKLAAFTYAAPPPFCERSTISFDATEGSLSSTELRFALSGSYDTRCEADEYFASGHFSGEYVGTR